MRIDLDIPNTEINKMVRQVRLWQAKKRVQIIDLIEETANAIAEDAKSRAPVDTGDLEKEIKVLITNVAEELGANVVADVYYARFVELGESFAPAHPFMLPAYEAHIPRFIIKLRAILSS